MKLTPIGTVHSPYTSIEQIPRGTIERLEEVAVVEVFHDYAEGLKDLDGFSHVILIVYFHEATEERLAVTPPLDDHPRGVFATRSPSRPNHLGVCIVELLKLEGRNLVVRGIDVLDDTPLLDIKPYTPYDSRSDIRIGWLEGRVPPEYIPR